VVDQPLTSLIFEQWNHIELTTPVQINASQELWIGYSCDQPDLDFPAGCDAGPAVVGYGDLISMNGTSWDDLFTYGLDYNWNLQGYLQLTTDDKSSAIPLSPFASQSINRMENTTMNGTLKRGFFKPGPSSVFNAPDRALIGYSVYRDGTLLTGTPITDLFYNDLGLPVGTYEYCVTAQYDECESEPVCGSVTITEPSCDPVNNLIIQNEQGSPDVTVTWSPPGTPPAWIHWDDGVNYDGIGLTGGGFFYVAARFGPDQLADYDGMYLTTVALFPLGYNTTYTLKVWVGANAGTLVVDQPLTTLVIEEWNQVDLSSAVQINASQELWIGYTCDQPDGDFPAGCDAGPAVIGYGDLISTDGTAWDDLATYGLSNNWNIQGYLQTVTGDRNIAIPLSPLPSHSSWNNNTTLPGNLARGFFKPGVMSMLNHSTRALLGYSVYRDGTLLTATPITDLFYDDFGLANGTYEYCVTAQYDNCESDPVCGSVDITVGINNPEMSFIKVYPNPASGYLYINTSEPLESVDILNFSGQTVYSIENVQAVNMMISTASFNPGIYFIRIRTEASVITRKVTFR
jgi:hypothetical protein